MLQWFNNRTVSTRFLIISVILIPFVLLLGGSGIWGAFRLQTTLQGTNSDELYSIYTLSEASESITELVNLNIRQTLNLAPDVPNQASNANNFKSIFDEDLAQLEQNWQAYKATDIDDEEAKLITQFDAAYPTWLANLHSLAQILQQSTSPTSAASPVFQLTSQQYALLNQISTTADTLESLVEQLKAKSYEDSQVKAGDATNLFNSVLWVISFALVGVVIIFMGTGFILRHSLVTLANSLFASNKQLKQAFDESEYKRQIAEAVSTQLKQMTGELSAVAIQQASRAQQESSAVQEITVSLGELAVTSRQIAGNAASVRETASHSLQSAHEVQISTVQTSQSAAEVQTTVSSTLTVIDQVRQAMDILNQNLQNLQIDSQRVSVILVLIKDIADQTHLLSLNAAIESAGAGPYGERFGVVALEVKQLAQRALAAATEVGFLLSEVQVGVQQAVLSSTNVSTKAQEAAEHSHSMVEVISQLTQAVGVTASRADRIVTDTEQVVTQTEEISLATQQQDSAVGQVSSTMISIDEVIQETALGSSQLSAASHAIDDLSHQLHINLG
jgi:methyl-accepting chemotaxis protein